MPVDSPLSDAIESLTARLSDALAAVLPAGADWQERLAPVIEATLSRLELVPREVFDRQRVQVEELTRDITRLEARVDALETSKPH